jgi:hypothetical protein
VSVDIEWFERLIVWQQGKESRSLKIEIGGYLPMHVFAYDTALLDGMTVKYPDMPDIEGKVETEERKKYDELKVKYGER